MLRIGIDGFNMAMRRGTGIATYGRVLSQCLTELGHPVDVVFGMPMSPRASSLMREVAFFNSFGQDGGRAAPTPLGRRWWRELLHAPFGLAAQEIPITGKVEARIFRSRMPSFKRILNVPDLFALAPRHFRRTGSFLKISVPDPPAIMHWTYPLPIRLAGARNVYTVHDMVPLRLPYATLDDKGYHMRLIRGCLRHGASLCTVSEASARDIVSLFPQAAGRVVNTYQSVEPAPAVAEDELRLMLEGLFDLRLRAYFLFFGALEPKKNIARLLDAYLSSGCKIPLVLVGGRSWQSEREVQIIAAHESVRPFDYVPFEQLTRLIAGARAVLFPSLSEGFGLPVVEAMALGTPVLTSREGSLPEIAGEAALLVDAYDTADMAAGMRRLESDDALCETLRARGGPQAARFGRDAYKLRISEFYAALLRK